MINVGSMQASDAARYTGAAKQKNENQPIVKAQEEQQQQAQKTAQDKRPQESGSQAAAETLGVGMKLNIKG